MYARAEQAKQPTSKHAGQRAGQPTGLRHRTSLGSDGGGAKGGPGTQGEILLWSSRSYLSKKDKSSDPRLHLYIRRIRGTVNSVSSLGYT